MTASFSLQSEKRFNQSIYAITCCNGTLSSNGQEQQKYLLEYIAYLTPLGSCYSFNYMCVNITVCMGMHSFYKNVCLNNLIFQPIFG